MPAAGGATAWDERIDELGTRYPTAVLSWVGPDGFPIAVRVPVKPDRGTQRIELGLAPAGLPMTDGLACLTAHAHAPDFTWQKNFQVRGDLIAGERGWSLVPHRLVGGFEMPESAAARSRLFISKPLALLPDGSSASAPVGGEAASSARAAERFSSTLERARPAALTSNVSSVCSRYLTVRSRPSALAAYSDSSAQRSRCFIESPSAG